MRYLKRAIFTFLLGLSLLPGLAQVPPLFDWQNSLGGTAIDARSKVIPCRNGGYLMAGNTASSNGNISFNHGSRDYWIVRLNSTGQIIWEKTYGGSGFEVATSIAELPDGKI